MHIKHRPKVWDDVVGQNHIKNALKNIRLKGRAILLEGEKGCGKTTIAYLLANDFGAPEENIEHINCVQTSKVEQIREYVKTFGLNTLFGKERVYIFDEPQELSHKAMEALLIPLEKLPENVLVVACCAKPSEISDMLIERFVRLRVRQLDKKTSKKFIDSICKKEGIDLTNPIKAMIVDKSEGIPRRILTSIPKIVDVHDETEVEYLLELTSIEDDEDILLLFKLLLNIKYSWSTIRAKLNLLLRDTTPESIRTGLMNLIGYRLTSKHLNNHKDGNNLVLCFNELKKARGFPEKSNIIVAVYQMSNFIRGV